MPHDTPIAITRNNERLSPFHVQLQKDTETLIQRIASYERARKAQLEAVKNLWMLEFSDRIDENEGISKAALKKERQRYLREEYVNSLRNVGLTRKNLTRHLQEAKQITVTDKSIRALDGTKLFDLSEGPAAFAATSTNENVPRAIYQKRGDVLTNQSAPKQYVKDSFGRFTRRYAYMEKSWGAFQALFTQAPYKLQGKDVQSKLEGDPRKKGPTVTKKYDFLSEDENRMSDPELAFVNQEDGSTTQRALAMSSTSKSLHGNEGYRFGRRDGVLLKIDLAKIPPHDNDNYLLLNLYSYTAQTGDDGEPATLGLTTYQLKRGKRGDLRFSGEESKEHTDQSTSKNRELSLLKLPLNAVVSVTFHDEDKLTHYAEQVRQASLNAGAEHEIEITYKDLDASRGELYED
jgi:hypothetical protein